LLPVKTLRLRGFENYSDVIYSLQFINNNICWDIFLPHFAVEKRILVLNGLDM